MIPEDRFPVGMIIILVLVGAGTLSSLSTLTRPGIALGPFIVKGAVATVFSIVIAGVLGLVFYGIVRRKYWARNLAIAVHAIQMLLALLGLLVFLPDKREFTEFLQFWSRDATLLTETYVRAIWLSLLVCGWIISLVIIVYLYRRREFFRNSTSERG